jgi:hypothetical protein
MIYAGIDEAGYGPVLGPLVVARSVFRLDGVDGCGEPQSLWKTMKSVVCRSSGDRRGRIAVGDSKTLYSASQGLKNLERGVLPFLHASGTQPGSLDDLLSAASSDTLTGEAPGPWYGDPEGRPKIPVSADREDLEACTARLFRFRANKGVRLDDLGAAVVFEERFNRIVERAGSKSACVWEPVAEHLRSIWEQYAGLSPFVAVDQLGGRKDYRGLLATSLPWADVVAADAADGLPEYIVSDGDRKMRVVFRARCEQAHLPVAMASMFSKYVRELLMLRFRAYWLELAPDVRPTYGYQPDGSRFVAEIAPTVERLGIRREALVRSR